MGIFGKSGRESNSSHSMAEYSSIPLVLSDESEDDVFDRDKENYGDLELQLLPNTSTSTSKSSIQPARDSQSQYKKTRPLTVCNIFCLLIFVLVSMLAVAVVIGLAIVSVRKHLVSGDSPGYNQTAEWEINFSGLASESHVRIFDVNGDGMEDVLLGAQVPERVQEYYHSLQRHNTPLHDYCKQQGRSYPCIGQLIAMQGLQGKSLWKVDTAGAVIYINCQDFDVNFDGYNDCVLTGRTGLVQAVNVLKGETLWISETALINTTWNTYYPVALPDLDGDHVPELLIANGGNPNYSPQNASRDVGRLLVLSGATGKPFGTRFYNLPDGKETYMSPVLYTCLDESIYILFGSGGETVAGSLMMISLKDLFKIISDEKLPKILLDGRYNHWSSKQAQNSVITLYKSNTKGVMVSPVIADINNDGVLDIVASVYDGHVMAFNGVDLSSLWVQEFPGQESYSTPTPGFFNEDEVLDFMVHWSAGQWPEYTKSKTLVLDGKNGKIIWSLETPLYEMTSDLSLKTSSTSSMFVFQIKGRELDPFMYSNGSFHHRTVPTSATATERLKRHTDDLQFSLDNFTESAEDHYRSNHLLCGEKVDSISEVFLMDRYLMERPLRVMKKTSLAYRYLSKEKYSDKDLSEEKMCIELIPADTNTGGIGDLDGDGHPELVMVTTFQGEAVDQGYSFDHMVYSLSVNKINLVDHLRKKNLLVSLPTIHTSNSSPTNEPASHFMPFHDQRWLQYRGTDGHNTYLNS